jgi:phosphoglycolate phosphatase
MAKAVIFDFDGTLGDTHDVSYEVYGIMAKRHGYKQLTIQELDELKSISIRKRLKSQNVPLLQVPKMMTESLHLYGELVEKAPFFKGMDLLVSELSRKGTDVAIVSSNSVANIEKFLLVHGFEDFSHIQGRASIFGKSFAIRKMIRKLKLKKDQAIYVGDEVRDVTACKKLGIKVVAVTWGYDGKELLEKAKPDFVVSSPEELKKILEDFVSL